METDLQSFAGVWAAAFSAAAESLTGSALETQADGSAPNSGTEAGDQWVQVLETEGVKLTLRVIAAERDWTALGGLILQAAPGDNLPKSDLSDAFMELVRQSSGQLAQHLEARLGRETQQGPLEPATGEDTSAEWYPVRLRTGDGWTGTLYLGIRCSEPPSQEPAPPPERRSRPARNGDPPRTLELLMEVELPVGVSFGRTQMRLRDAIKLTTGSIVELNRSVSEQVEVIVNNCVIARGEVVVVEGNYGVRIQEIVSPEERLRTLF